MTDWDQCYRTGDTPWNRGEPSPPLVQYLREHPLQGRVLVPGCGVGHDVAFIARQGNVEVTGLDISPLALEKAAQTYPGLPDTIWRLANLFDLPPDCIGAFDAVVEHTCLSAMPPALRPQYGAAIRAALKPGGLIVGVWYINPELDPGYEGPPYPLPLGELDALFADGFEIVADYVPDIAFEGREGRERLRALRRTR